MKALYRAIAASLTSDADHYQYRPVHIRQDGGDLGMSAAGWAFKFKGEE